MRWKLTLYAIFASSFSSSQTLRPSEPVKPMPPDREAEVYALYSFVLQEPVLSHPDSNKTYLIEDTTGEFYGRLDPARCIQVDPEYRQAFTEIVAGYVTGKADRFRIQPRFRAARPYKLLSESDARRVMDLLQPSVPIIVGRSPGNREAFEKEFPGSTDLIRLSNVYFNRERTFAVMLVSAYCGPTCGRKTIDLFGKNQDGTWRRVKLSQPVCGGVISWTPPNPPVDSREPARHSCNV